MRRLAAALALCTATFVAACSDDASHGTHTQDGSQQAASAGSADAFNRAATAGNGASEAAPLVPPVVHYPPESDDDAASSPATPATPASAASSPG